MDTVSDQTHNNNVSATEDKQHNTPIRNYVILHTKSVNNRKSQRINVQPKTRHRPQTNHYCYFSKRNHDIIIISEDTSTTLLMNHVIVIGFGPMLI